jgi:hypothetical protein
MTTPRTARAIRAANTRGALKSALARVIRLPMPKREALDSAMTEPTQASVMATLGEANR